MEMKNLCGKIPVALHLKVRAEIEQREISTQQFIQQVIEEHFMEKGVNRMEARTIAVHESTRNIRIHQKAISSQPGENHTKWKADHNL